MVNLQTWEFLIQSPIKNENKISLPREIQDTVVSEHLMKGPVIHWNVDHQNEFVVLSEQPLRNNTYSHVGAYKIYGIDEPDAYGGNIRPPERITDFWPVELVPGKRVFFLSHSRMCQSENPSVYLLSESQLLKLLPDRPGTMHQEGQAVPDGLFEVPGLVDL